MPIARHPPHRPVLARLTHTVLTLDAWRRNVCCFAHAVRNFTFEACSGFTRVTACRVARPPEVTSVTRLQPGLLPDQTACQLPDLPTTIWVGLPPTSDLHIRRSEIRGESKMLWARLLAYVTGTVL